MREKGRELPGRYSDGVAGSPRSLGHSSCSDLPFHLNIASSFISGGQLDGPLGVFAERAPKATTVPLCVPAANEDKGITDSLTSTFYAGAPLAYPFIPGEP